MRIKWDAPSNAPSPGFISQPAGQTLSSEGYSAPGAGKAAWVHLQGAATRESGRVTKEPPQRPTHGRNLSATCPLLSLSFPPFFPPSLFLPSFLLVFLLENIAHSQPSERQHHFYNRSQWGKIICLIDIHLLQTLMEGIYYIIGN